VGPPGPVLLHLLFIRHFAGSTQSEDRLERPPPAKLRSGKRQPFFWIFQTIHSLFEPGAERTPRRADFWTLAVNKHLSETRWRREFDSNCHVWTQPRAQGRCSDCLVCDCGHVSGLLMERRVALRAMMEIRAPSPDQANGLSARQFDRFERCRSDRFAISFADNLRNSFGRFFSGAPLRRRPGGGNPRCARVAPTAHLRSYWPMPLPRYSRRAVLLLLRSNGYVDRACVRRNAVPRALRGSAMFANIDRRAC
jgi:hypothetical protein